MCPAHKGVLFVIGVCAKLDCSLVMERLSNKTLTSGSVARKGLTTVTDAKPCDICIVLRDIFLHGMEHLILAVYVSMRSHY